MDELPQHPVFDPQDPFTFVSQYGHGIRRTRKPDEDIILYFDIWERDSNFRLITASGELVRCEAGTSGMGRSDSHQKKFDEYGVMLDMLEHDGTSNDMHDAINEDKIMNNLHARIMVKHVKTGRMAELYWQEVMNLEAAHGDEFMEFQYMENRIRMQEVEFGPLRESLLHQTTPIKARVRFGLIKKKSPASEGGKRQVLASGLLLARV